MKNHPKKNGSGTISDQSFLIVGTVRNCGAFLHSNVMRFTEAFADAKSLYWLIFESDSTDDTVEELVRLRTTVNNFVFSSFGLLEKKIKLRTARISHCRNAYAEEIRTNPMYQNIDYVVVADFDDINQLIDKNAILSCWEKTDWDVCAANQAGYYYDIWALRHKDWCTGDCWAQFRFLSKYTTRSEQEILDACVGTRQILIPSTSDWIEVESAFGGLAIYRKALFDNCTYDGIDADGNELCEHVSFHREIKKSGGRIFINPKMINCSTVHHEPASWFARAKNFFGL